MNVDKNKLQKLTDIARLYYEQDMTQSEIAKRYGVSRPLISRMLKEAKDAGIVKIEICPPFPEGRHIMELACEIFGLRGGIAVPARGNDNLINDAVSLAAVGYMEKLKQSSCGIGWGHIIGNLVSLMEKSEPVEGLVYKVCPLIGNSGVGNRNYHSNELVRIFAQQCHAAPEYFYAPFIVTSEQEREIFEELESYRVIEKLWAGLDMALVNIGNYPSVPDFASEARYGDMLRREKAVGKILNYYLDVNGRVFHSDMDYALQIPLEALGNVKQVVGICSANTSSKALVGALRTGLLHHVIAPMEILRGAVEYSSGCNAEPGCRGEADIATERQNQKLHM